MQHSFADNYVVVVSHAVCKALALLIRGHANVCSLHLRYHSNCCLLASAAAMVTHVGTLIATNGMLHTLHWITSENAINICLDHPNLLCHKTPRSTPDSVSAIFQRFALGL